jgi:hypothetical protein
LLVVELPSGNHLLVFRPWGGPSALRHQGVVARKTRALSPASSSR